MEKMHVILESLDFTPRIGQEILLTARKIIKLGQTYAITIPKEMVQIYQFKEQEILNILIIRTMVNGSKRKIKNGKNNFIKEEEIKNGSIDKI